MRVHGRTQKQGRYSTRRVADHGSNVQKMCKELAEKRAWHVRVSGVGFRHRTAAGRQAFCCGQLQCSSPISVAAVESELMLVCQCY